MLENGSNNGSLYLSVRDAADRLGLIDPASVSAAFEELIDRGLIYCTKEAHFKMRSSDGSRARCWGLTWLTADGKPAKRNWAAYDPPAESKARNRFERGARALKRYYKALTSHRLPVRETITSQSKRACPQNEPVRETIAENTKNPEKTVPSKAGESIAHTAITITRPGSVWWRARKYLRLPDVNTLKAANDGR